MLLEGLHAVGGSSGAWRREPPMVEVKNAVVHHGHEGGTVASRETRPAHEVNTAIPSQSACAVRVALVRSAENRCSTAWVRSQSVSRSLGPVATGTLGVPFAVARAAALVVLKAVYSAGEYVSPNATRDIKTGNAHSFLLYCDTFRNPANHARQTEGRRPVVVREIGLMSHIGKVHCAVAA